MHRRSLSDSYYLKSVPVPTFHKKLVAAPPAESPALDQLTISFEDALKTTSPKHKHRRPRPKQNSPRRRRSSPRVRHRSSGDLQFRMGYSQTTTTTTSPVSTLATPSSPRSGRRPTRRFRSFTSSDESDQHIAPLHSIPAGHISIPSTRRNKLLRNIEALRPKHSQLSLPLRSFLQAPEDSNPQPLNDTKKHPLLTFHKTRLKQIKEGTSPTSLPPLPHRSECAHTPDPELRHRFVCLAAQEELQCGTITETAFTHIVKQSARISNLSAPFDPKYFCALPETDSSFSSSDESHDATRILRGRGKDIPGSPTKEQLARIEANRVAVKRVQKHIWS